MPSFTTQQLADRVNGALLGPGDLIVSTVSPLDQACVGSITFIRDKRFLEAWRSSTATAALVSESVELGESSGSAADRALIRVPDADVAMATVLELFAPPAPNPPAGIHQSATVDLTATLGKDVRIGPGARIGSNVVIGDRTIVHANVVILDESRVGDDCVLWPGVVIRDRCTLGHRCIIHPCVTIGADGFNYRPHPQGKGLIKIPQIGTVQISDDVEIGANTCVDRGKFGPTVIGAGTKIDNLCQIAHNCRLGRCVIMAGGAMLAGSVVVDDGVMLGGRVGVRDHVHIGARAQVMAYAAVMNDIPAGETWGGYPAQEYRTAIREVAAVRKLPALLKTLRPRPD